MKFRNEITCMALRRALASTPLCVRKRRGRAHIYIQPDPANPDTERQQTARQGLADIAGAWNSLAPERQEEWKAAAARLVCEFPNCGGVLSCYNLYTQCAVNCAILGEQPPGKAPGCRRPDPLTSIELLPAGKLPGGLPCGMPEDVLEDMPDRMPDDLPDDPASYTFRLRHAVRPGACGLYRVITSLTPATPKLTYRPDRSRLQLIHGYSAASGPQLPESGGTVQFTGAAVAIARGRRFGVSMRIVRLPEGLASEGLFIDLKRT